MSTTQVVDVRIPTPQLRRDPDGRTELSVSRVRPADAARQTAEYLRAGGNQVRCTLHQSMHEAYWQQMLLAQKPGEQFARVQDEWAAAPNGWETYLVTLTKNPELDQAKGN